MDALQSTVMVLVARERNKTLELCTLETCRLDTSYYYYRMSIGSNATFLTLFAISFIGFIITLALTRRAYAFSVAMLCGVALEIIGYIGRIMNCKNQWEESGFLMQIVCLTIAPAFLAGGIYLCLRRIVYAFGPENSRISPEACTRIFIPCDIASLLLQAAGGRIASEASHSNKDTTAGNNIMIAGLAVQVATLFIFILLCIDFAWRTKKRYSSLGSEAFDQNSLYITLRSGWQFKGFLIALALATICIFWRCVYRVAELAQGWDGALIKRQWLFVGFEGVMVIVACLALNLFNPAFTFKEAMENGLGGLGSKRKLRKQQEKGEVTVTDGSVSNSDADGVKNQRV